MHCQVEDTVLVFDVIFQKVHFLEFFFFILTLFRQEITRQKLLSIHFWLKLSSIHHHCMASFVCSPAIHWSFGSLVLAVNHIFPFFLRELLRFKVESITISQD